MIEAPHYYLSVSHLLDGDHGFLVGKYISKIKEQSLVFFFALLGDEGERKEFECHLRAQVPASLFKRSVDQFTREVDSSLIIQESHKEFRLVVLQKQVD